jgi:lysyl endopeptidase
MIATRLRSPMMRAAFASVALAGVLHAAVVLGAAASTQGADRPSVTSAAPAEVEGGAVVRRVQLQSAPGVRARRIDLLPPAAAEEATMKRHNAALAALDGKGMPLAIGFGRDLPRAARRVDVSDLAWEASADGGRVARIEIASPGAVSLRVAVAMTTAEPGLELRFAGSSSEDQAFGAYPAGAIAAETALYGVFWSPMLAGEVAVIELHVVPGASVPRTTFDIARVSHVLVEGADLNAPSQRVMKTLGLGTAGACNVDLACVVPTSTAAVNLARAVAKLTFVGDDGGAYVCTGTLLNDSVHSQTPYLLSASHCLESARIARTLNTFWFFDAAACNSKATPSFVQLTGGALLLGRSQDHDWTIVRLLDAPPVGAQFAAWRAEPIAQGTAVISLHHPHGDVVKWSKGVTTGDLLIDDGFAYSRFTEVVWSQGVTEPGSSGGALATLSMSGDYYEVRGGLYAGASSCSAPHDPDYYSNLQDALPVMRQYLSPNAANPNGIVVAVEFYNRSLDHYFLSTNPPEIDNLDSGRTVGWERTGLRFLVYDHPAPGSSPVCRFYRAPAYGDSHFYSADPAECAATAAAHPVDWIYESASVFHVPLPDRTTGACPSGTRPVYRYFNASTTNHRYTAETVIRNDLTGSKKWTAEGYGPGPYYPAMCALAQ